MNGIIPLYKEQGMTSFDCVKRVRALTGEKKCGHSGTLDPDVDGVLPICLGKATKVVPYLQRFGKQYHGELLVGESTTTQDLSGEIVDKKTVKQPIEKSTIEKAIKQLTGTITQTPPMYSAVKVNGKRLYEYARAGETVERPSRQVQIKKFDLIGTDYDSEKQMQRIRVNVECSKGTYIRTLLVDLAKLLGYPGTMSRLTRLQSGGFTLEQTLSLEDVRDAITANTLKNYLVPLDYALRDYPAIDLRNQQWEAVKHGGWLKPKELSTKEPTVALKFGGSIKALYQLRDGVYKPLKMFETE